MQFRSLFHKFVAFWVTILILCAPITSHAWGAGGHMIVAQIAFGQLNKHAKAEVQRLLAIPIKRPGLQPRSQLLLTNITGNSKDFVNAAHWADDLRSIPEFDSYKPLHFVDHPFSDDGSSLPAVPTPNIIDALRDNVKTLKSNTADDHEKAIALRLIIHFVGDIHQPLHCATRADRANPQGDRGGNLVKIMVPDAKGQMKTTSLHSYWDGGLGTFPVEGAPPNFSPPSLAQIAAAANKAVAANRDSLSLLKALADTGELTFDDDNQKFKSWSDQSVKIAEAVAYKGIQNGSKPSAEYRKAGARLAQYQVVEAGYRLAALLNHIWQQ